MYSDKCWGYLGNEVIISVYYNICVLVYLYLFIIWFNVIFN